MDGRPEKSVGRVHRALLGVGESASSAEIREAYRMRASLLHPDQHEGRGDAIARAATDAMQQLNEAYRSLMREVDELQDQRRASAGGLGEVAYDLGGWPDEAVAALLAALSDASIGHRWSQREELVVSDADEAVVDGICGEIGEFFQLE